MEMTIEKAHEILSNGLVNASSEHEWCVAFKMAIDTMRKYQKIEQIVNAEFEEYHPLDRNIYRLALIRKVIEDGNEH